MLIILLVSLIFYILLTFYSFNKKIISTSFLLGIIFTIGTFFAIIGNTVWKIQVQSYTLLFILLPLFSVYLGEFFVKDIKISKPQRNANIYFHIPKAIIFLVTIFGFFVVVLYLYQLLSFIRAAGHAGIMLGFFRDSAIQSSRDEYPISNFVILLSNIITICGQFFIFIYIYNKIFFSKSSITYIFPVLPMLLLFILQTSRASFITLITYLFILFVIFFEQKNNKHANKKIIKYGFRVVLLIFILFSVLGITTGKTTSLSGALHSIVVYAGSSIVALDRWIYNGAHKAATTDSESFYGFLSLINHFGFNFKVRPYLPYIRLPNSVGTNIYTAFRAYYADFGILGLFIVPFIQGCVFTYWSKIIKEKKASFFSIFMFSKMFSGVLYSLFTPTCVSSLFSANFCMQLVFAYFIVNELPLLYNRFGFKYLGCNV